MFRTNEPDGPGSATYELRSWVAAIAVLAGFFAYQAFPYAETKYRPVVSTATVLAVTEVTDGVVISMQAEKLRSCKFFDVEVYLGNRWSQTSPRVKRSQFLDAPKEREKGVIVWDKGLFVPITKKQFDSGIHIDVLHRCYSPLSDRLTRSQFYPTEKPEVSE